MNKKYIIFLVIVLIILGIYLTKTLSNKDKINKDLTNSKILVVYYSATGSTKRIANIIKNNLNADIFEVVPVIPYTSSDLNWTDTESRVTKEHDDESKRNVELVKQSVSNFDEYDTIIIGYPIWWGEASWAINNFVKNNDFTGKTVIPFCTSASSSIGNSAKLLEDLAKTGNWTSGHRFSSNATESEIKNWTDSLK